MAPMNDRTIGFEFEFAAGGPTSSVVAFQGTEGISELFRYDIDLAFREESFTPEEILGKEAVLRMRSPEGDRLVRGIVAQLERLDRSARFFRYRVRLVPKVWTLTLRHDLRIFQGKTAPDIIREVLTRAGVPSSEFQITVSGQTVPEREYCVQYRESDWNFISRLLEEEGIPYFFQHEEDVTKLVMTNAPATDRKISGDDAILYREHGFGTAGAEHVRGFRFLRQLRAGSYMLQDFDFKQPSLNLGSTSEQAELEREPSLRMYDYPGEYVDPEVGRTRAKVRLEEQRAIRQIGSGEGGCSRFEAGYVFALEEHPFDDLNGRYLLTRVQHHGRQPQAMEEDAGRATGPTYENSFDCIPARIPFRPRRWTPRPRVDGPQTAIVTGPGGEEIHTDAYGRVKVQFHWDREGKRDDRSSCWIRVSQGWAGSGWGMMIIPRIGQEVIVDFLEGDPDQPIITGRVYNGASPPPYALPDGKTRSTLISNSSPGGGGSNEIRFEDGAGGEEIYIHGQKDWNTVIENNRTTLVKNDHSEEVGHDRTRQVGNDETIHVKANRTKTVDADQSETVGGSKSITVTGTHTESIGGKMDITVSGALSETVKSTYSENVLASMTVRVGGPLSVTVGAAHAAKVAGNYSQSVGGNGTESISGNQSVTVSKDRSEKITGGAALEVGKDAKCKVNGKAMTKVAKEYALQAKKVAIVADDELTLKTGSAQIQMKKNGDIIIKGKKITIKGSGEVIVKGSKVKAN